MPRTVSVVAWRRPGKVIGVGLAVLLVSQYLAGFFFLWSLRLDTRKATPMTVARYGYYYGDRQPVRRRLVRASLAAMALVSLAGIVLILPKPRSLHGEAQFAGGREIARAGLFSPEGIFLGRFKRRYLILSGQQGAIVSAPPRSDKGTGICVPNCLLFPGSLLCLDMKHELWHLTAGFRQRLGQPCFRVNPLDPDTACTNPMSYVSKEPNRRISGLQRIGASLFPETPGTDPFWTSGGRGMFLGLGLYVLETPSLPPTIGEVLRQGMASDAEGFAEHWKRIISGRQSGRYPLSPQCVRAIADIMDLAPVTASSIRKTFTSRLDLFANPLIDAATSRNDFDWRDLRRRPMSIYLGIQPGDLHLLRPLLNLFLEQAIACQTDELPEHHPELKYQVLMLLDEMTAPGRIPILAQAISYLPGYNVRLLLVIQAYSQLREVYGANAADTMMKSLAARVLYAPKDYAEANEISQELGNTTVKVRTYSQPGISLSDTRGRRSRSVSISEQRRPLLLPQEVKELDRDAELILYEGLRPILARKNRYYEDPLFKKRLFPPPARPTPCVAPPPPPPPTTPAPASVEPAHEIDRQFREATAADVDRIDSLTLDDFAVDLSAVQVPEKANGERLSAQEMHAVVESFLQSLQG